MRTKSSQPPIDILPVQIREDLTVHIAGIPHDLTKAEADKIARVVMAMVAADAGLSAFWRRPRDLRAEDAFAQSRTVNHDDM